jgi:hypothetical protein
VLPALLSYEGRPADHQLANIRVLQDELKGIEQAFEGLLKTEPAAINQPFRPQAARRLPRLRPTTMRPRRTTTWPRTT